MTSLANPGESQALHAHIDPRHAERVAALFDVDFYALQAGKEFADATGALLHYFEEGAAEGLDPSPFFDTEFYYSQHERLARRSVNALVHYVEYGPQAKSCNPNPLFGNGYYLAANPELRGGAETPFAHFVGTGCRQGRVASLVHQELVNRLGMSSRAPLTRGGWKNGSVLFFAQGARSAELPLHARELLLREHKLESTAVLLGRPEGLRGNEVPAGVLVLDEFPRPDVLRPSALRLLALTLASSSVLVVTDVVEALEGARAAGTPSYFVVLDEPRPALGQVAERADRIVFGSRELFHAGGGPHPPNVAVRLHDGSGPVEARRAAAERFTRALLDLAGRDFGLDASGRPDSRRNVRTASRRIIVPCPDWSVSGVNAALEAVGRELQRLGWEIDLVFTRDRATVEQSAGSETRLPELPYRFLERHATGAEGMWQALIADVQRRAPCTVLMAYDFIANGFAPALTEDVGVVMWLQADDGDYYEQAYRLGRYCNAVVCVSEHIKETVTALHPGIGSRSHVIHNTSVSERDLAGARPPRSDRLRIVYTGRLVQYQKRILDFVALAEALDARGVPYEISLIGTFPVHDEAAGLFHERAARHLDAGTIRLPGRLSRERIFEALRASDFFVLLSDFEGLPLSLGEAMAAGCVPVVADMKSGISELLTSGENGLIVKGRDYARWAGVLVDLWNDRAALSEMSQRARRTVRDGFTVERIAQQFDELFRQVADEIATGYVRPPALHWGERRSRTGDVLPPPIMYRPVPIAGLG